MAKKKGSAYMTSADLEVEKPKETPMEYTNDACNELQAFITQNYDTTIYVTDSVSYSMRAINDESYQMYSRIQKGIKTEESGFVRTYFAKSWVVYRTLLMGSDIDMKNLNIRSNNGIKFRVFPILKMAFTTHLSRQGFGDIIDKIMSEMCWFGSSIVKRFDGGIDTVELRNYVTEGNISDPQNRRHAEMNFFSYDEALQFKKDWGENWDAVEETWEVLRNQGESAIKVVEFWTWAEMDEKMRKVCYRFLDRSCMKANTKNPQNWSPYLQLECFVTPYTTRRNSKKARKALGDDEDMFPYEQFDLFRVFGRGQAMGVAELLAGVQSVYNTIFNSQVKNTMKGQLGVHVHNAVAGVDGLTEILQDNIANLTEGGVITLSPGETMQTLALDPRTEDWNLFDDKLYELMRQMIGITAQGTGEEAPAATSATQANINQQTANTVYDFVRERMHHGLKRLFTRGYAKDVWDEIDEKELAAVVGSPVELQEIDNYYVTNLVNDWAYKMKETTGMYPTQEEYDAHQEKLKEELRAQGDTRFVELKKSLLKDIEMDMEFDITSESVDTRARFDALSALRADPLSTKSKARIEDEILILQNLNPRQYDKSKEELAQDAAMLAAQQAEANPMAPPPGGNGQGGELPVFE